MGRTKLSTEQRFNAADARLKKARAEVLGPERESSPPPIPERPVVDFAANVPIDFDDLIEANWGKSIEECLDPLSSVLTKREAQRWAWDSSDELAIAKGCRFDIVRAMHFAYCLRNHLQLWEGRWAGEPFILRTWQVECLMRVFGWVRPHPSLKWVRRYTKACIWVPKKHGKSPVGAGIGVYLWLFDGIWNGKVCKKEHGQHVYSIARNGKQAQIVHRHACNMVKNSPTLKRLMDLTDGEGIKWHRATHRLTHEPTDSTYEILSGDSGVSMDAAEGLNAGGIICDEAHVVDQKTVDVTTDAGASRDQPLWAQVSTYGKGQHTYGKKNCDYGRDVASGKVDDDAFLFKSYGAPDDATDEDCGREEIWRQANPNYGFTVNPLQLQQSYDRAKNDPSELSGFKQRRLNIWQAALNPFLNEHAWSACAGEVTLEDVAGGAAGLDLAASEDFAALAIAAEKNETIYLWVKIWAAGKYLDENSHRIPAHRFIQSIEVSEGGAIHLPTVQDQVGEILRQTGVRILGYDKTFALQMAQGLQETTASEIYAYSQSLPAYAAGTAAFKTAVNNGRLVHLNNPCLNWMIGHCDSVKRGDMEKPVKNDDTPWLKIDAVQAAVMAVDCLQYVEAGGISFGFA